MGYFVERVVICDAYSEPDKHYHLLPGGRATLRNERRPSIRYLASAKETKSGIAGILGKQATLFEDMATPKEHLNEFVNEFRNEVRQWRESGYQNPPGIAYVTRRLLEWWFERDDERKAEGKRFFFCQREAVESVIYLYEVKKRQKMPETGDLVRYALKMATGTGKTLVMALLITWCTLHKKKVSNSSLSDNFLVIVPNLTVRDRVSGFPRGDGLDPAGPRNLYNAFDTVPPEYANDFDPNVIVRNWQGMNPTSERDDWIPDDFGEEGRFVPASVLWAIRRRRNRDPDNSVKQIIGNWRDLVIVNDEAHHVYGEKRVPEGKEPDYIKWNSILNKISKAAGVSLVVDLSATPWYGSGSPKQNGTLFEWLVTDFSVYDAFESGLTKVVRLPGEEDKGRIYIDLWRNVQGARTKDQYLSACRGALEHVYSSWKDAYQEWFSQLEFARGSPPVLLLVAENSTEAKWIFEHVTSEYKLLRNADSDDPRDWITIEVNSKIFDAEKGNEAILRHMVNTVGSRDQPGQNVRCIVSVNMLTEGWDVKTVTHILGIRRFGSPLLTEQIIGRGLRRTNYDILNQPLEERGEGSEETLDAIGIPFIGFPVERRKRPRTGEWGQKPVWIESDSAKANLKIVAPNVKAWATGITKPLTEIVKVDTLPMIMIKSSDTPPKFWVNPPFGDELQQEINFDRIREENPVLLSGFRIATELLERIDPKKEGGLPRGPVFEEVIGLVLDYFQRRLRVETSMDLRDVAIVYWRQKVLDILHNAVTNADGNGVCGIPILGTPEWLDTSNLRRFQWTGITYPGKKTHTNLVPCHTELEGKFASFLDSANDVIRYFKNERLGFSISYFEDNRPRQYHPDFIVVQKEGSRQILWIAEPKGEIRPDTTLKSEAAESWCRKMSGHIYGDWRYVLVPQQSFEEAIRTGVKTFSALAARMRAVTVSRGLL
jgi:type III restriction enzyme